MIYVGNRWKVIEFEIYDSELFFLFQNYLNIITGKRCVRAKKSVAVIKSWKVWKSYEQLIIYDQTQIRDSIGCCLCLREHKGDQ